jgi:hypothetical protein
VISPAEGMSMKKTEAFLDARATTLRTENLIDLRF